jgi:hypothetical protein
MKSIVKQLDAWVRRNAADLVRKGILVEYQNPPLYADVPWKAHVGLSRDEIVASYTVWERGPLQTELIVLNAKTKQTIVTTDKNVESAEVVDADLDDLVAKLTARTFVNMKPDPKLMITG